MARPGIMSRRHWLRTAALGAGALLLPREAAAWNVVRHNDRDYVTGRDVARFYRFPEYRVQGNRVTFRTGDFWMRGTIGGHELAIRGVKFILSLPIESRNGDALFSRLDLVKLVDPVLRPDYIRGTPDFNTVVIDPGHGGHDPGARGPFGDEKTFALRTALQLQAILRGMRYQVVMTRSDDRFVTLSDRVAIANRHPRSVFISIHFNDAANRSARGIETFALAPEGAASTVRRWREDNLDRRRGNLRDAENIALATAAHSGSLRQVASHNPMDRGIKRARFTVISGIAMPGILFEGGFVRHPQEGRLISTPSYQRLLAQGLAAGVRNYRAALR